MTRLLTLTCLLYLLTLQLVHANPAEPKNTNQPAYYLVFTANQLDQPELVFQRRVIMQTLPAGHGPDEFEVAETQRLAGGDLVSARVLGKDGRILFQKMIDEQRDIRSALL